MAKKVLGYIKLQLPAGKATPQPPVGTSDGRLWLASNTVYGFSESAVSAETGLMTGDTVIKVGNVPVHTGQELAYEIMIQGKKSETYEQKDAESGEYRHVDVVHPVNAETRSAMFHAVDDAYTALTQNHASEIAM